MRIAIAFAALLAASPALADQTDTREQTRARWRRPPIANCDPVVTRHTIKDP